MFRAKHAKDAKKDKSILAFHLLDLSFASFAPLREMLFLFLFPWRSWRALRETIFCLLILIAGGRAIAADPPLPRDAPDRHEGPTACAQSQCHGAAQPSAFAVVQEDEYNIWRSQDPHAKAFKALASPAAKKIARNLGLGDPQQEGRCLSCHTDFVPEARRGKKFALSDGVTCEACHGAAERWIGDHSNGRRTHAENVASGMFPTDDPVQRGRVCFSCHMGTVAHPMTHVLLGAGHPRLAIELDTFTTARPAHHREDADYRQRKPGQSPTRTWALGQVQAAVQWLALARSSRLGTELMPEYGFFECYGCHRSLVPGTPSAGGPRYDDCHVRMLAIVAERVLPSATAEIHTQLARLAGAQGRGAAETALATLAAAADKVDAAARGYSYTKEDARAWQERLLRLAREGEYVRYATAEQASYALGALAAALEESERPAVQAALDALFKTADDGSAFDPAAWRKAADNLARQLR
jgi:hypothetical protein